MVSVNAAPACHHVPDIVDGVDTVAKVAEQGRKSKSKLCSV